MGVLLLTNRNSYKIIIKKEKKSDIDIDLCA